MGSKPSARRQARSARRCTGGGNPYEWRDEFVGGQVLVGIKPHRDAGSLTTLRLTCWQATDHGSSRSQHPSPTTHRHVFRQRDFRGHGKSQFHNRAFGQRGLGVKENSTSAQVLNKSRHSPSVEVNRQWLVHLETLRPAAFHTIGTCHGSSSSFPDLLSRRPIVNSIADRSAREVASRSPARPVEIRLESKHSEARGSTPFCLSSPRTHRENLELVKIRRERLLSNWSSLCRSLP